MNTHIKDNIMELSTNKFWWDGKEGLFSQNISSLQLPKGVTFQLGITLKNPKTCGREHFMYKKTHYDTEGDVTHWAFESENNLTMLIWND